MTPTRNRLAALFLLGVLPILMAAPIQAATELVWLKDAPVRYFTDRDWELARNAIQEALEATVDGATTTWENPETGHHGSIMPVSTSGEGDDRCRKAKIANHANNRDGGGTFDFCRRPDGTWGMVESGAPR